MADVTYSSLTEGTVFDGDSLNTRLAGVKDAINDVSELGFASGAFNENHLPSFVISSEQVSVGTGASQHSYNSGQFSSSLWTEISSGGGATNNQDLRLSPLVDLTDPSIGGLFIMADVYINRIHLMNTSTSNTRQNAVGIAVSVYRSGSWARLTWTERFVADGINATGAHSYSKNASEYASQSLRVPIRTLITSSDVSSVDYVRLQLRLPTAGSGTPYTQAKLRRTTLSGMVLHSTSTS